MGSTDAQIDRLIALFPNMKRQMYRIEQPEHAVQITKAFYLGGMK